MKPTCSSCGARIRWAKTPRGRMIPLDPERVEDGNIVLDSSLFGETIARQVDDRSGTHRTHFVSCPYSDQHRRRRRPRRATP